LPFLRWAWLRIIPVTIRLHPANLLNLEPVRRQATQGFVASLAQEITEVVLVQSIDRLQISVRQGELTNWLFASVKRQPYIDLNNVNEIEASPLLLSTFSSTKSYPRFNQISSPFYVIVSKAFSTNPPSIVAYKIYQESAVYRKQ
jgi:hypothetical protein